MYKKQKKGLIFLVAGGLLIYVASFFYHATSEASKDSMVINTKLPKEYNQLFNKATLNKLHLQTAVEFKNRNPIAFFIYDKKYALELTKMDVENNFRLKEDIIENYTRLAGKYPEYKIPYYEQGITTNYKVRSDIVSSKIYLTLFGDSVTAVLKNEHVAAYYLELKGALT